MLLLTCCFYLILIDSIWSSATDKSGAYLIDRTPMYFGPILHFLRTGNIIIEPNVDPSGKKREKRIIYLEKEYFVLSLLINFFFFSFEYLGVLDEARFFGVIPVVEHLENLLNVCSFFFFLFFF